jgi:hypothetical protein
LFFQFRLGSPVHLGGQTFNKKSFRIAKGTPLPYTFARAQGAIVFVVQKDLSVTFNGKRLEKLVLGTYTTGVLGTYTTGPIFNIFKDNVQLFECKAKESNKKN